MSDLLLPGLELMLMGMGVVFVFLITLVFITSFMSRLVNQFYRPEPVTPTSTQNSATAPAASEPVSPQTLAIIREAIRQHRDRQKRSA